MTYQNLYFEFLLRCEDKQALVNKKSAHISAKLMALFVVIALKHAHDQTMTVSDAMALQDIASSAALHHRIDDLREAGMICVIYRGVDRRTKYLIPTEKGAQYLSMMGDFLRANSHHLGA